MPSASIAVPHFSFDQVGVSSDSHWGAGDGSDVANYRGDDAVWDAMFDYRPRIDVFVRIGDWWDFWRDPYYKVLRHNEERTRILARRLRQEHRYFVGVPGNHDWVPADKLARDLAAFGLDSDVFTIATPHLVVAGWQLEHGHRFDKWCDPSSPLFYIGRTAVGAWGLINDALYGPPVDPGPRTLAARYRGGEAIEGVTARAVKWAVANKVNLCFGHTHALGVFRDASSGVCVANTGCCSEGRASWVLLQSNGEATPRPIEGVF